ncbi:hypothetical protein LINGRAHAP2_LOCUS9419 [Linum grandiflorum]
MSSKVSRLSLGILLLIF